MFVGLTQIKGIGYNFATAILDTLKIDSNSNIGNLTDDNVQGIEKLITDRLNHQISQHGSSTDKKILKQEMICIYLTSDIPFTLRNDIERERITASWRGYRHLSGLKVRGQRTRTSGRKGGAVGVAKGGLAASSKEISSRCPAAAATADTPAPDDTAASSRREESRSPAEEKKE